MDLTDNVPARIQADAKARALAILNSEPDCISYVRPEDLETASLFIPVVSVIKPTADDFYPPIPKAGIMAKPPLVNLLKEKAGINITRTETSKRGDYIYVAHCWGEKRQPDGSMLTEDAEYEFDCNIRAELDHPGDNEKERRRHVLELAKFGNQRAVTGAEHSLIHKLAHVARSFKTEAELMRGMKVLRIDRNINGVMAMPGMQQAAIDRMLGAKEAVYGPKQIEGQPISRTYDEDGEREEPTSDASGEPDLFENELEPVKTPVEKARETLEGYREKMKNSAKATKLLEDTLANKDATLQEVNHVIDLFIHHLQKNSEGGAA